MKWKAPAPSQERGFTVVDGRMQHVTRLRGYTGFDFEHLRHARSNDWACSPYVCTECGRRYRVPLPNRHGFCSAVCSSIAVGWPAREEVPHAAD